jgi:hypothetical protein
VPDSSDDDFKPDPMKCIQSKLSGRSPSPVYGAGKVNRKVTKIGDCDLDYVFALDSSGNRSYFDVESEVLDLVDILGSHSTPPRRFASHAYSSEFFSERKTEWPSCQFFFFSSCFSIDVVTDWKLIFLCSTIHVAMTT